MPTISTPDGKSYSHEVIQVPPNETIQIPEGETLLWNNNHIQFFGPLEQLPFDLDFNGNYINRCTQGFYGPPIKIHLVEQNKLQNLIRDTTTRFNRSNPEIYINISDVKNSKDPTKSLNITLATSLSRIAAGDPTLQTVSTAMQVLELTESGASVSEVIAHLHTPNTSIILAVVIGAIETVFLYRLVSNASHGLDPILRRAKNLVNRFTRQPLITVSPKR